MISGPLTDASSHNSHLINNGIWTRLRFLVQLLILVYTQSPTLHLSLHSFLYSKVSVSFPEPSIHLLRKQPSPPTHGHQSSHFYPTCLPAPSDPPPTPKRNTTCAWSATSNSRSLAQSYCSVTIGFADPNGTPNCYQSCPFTVSNSNIVHNWPINAVIHKRGSNTANATSGAGR